MAKRRTLEWQITGVAMGKHATLRPQAREAAPDLRRRIGFSFLGVVTLACAIAAALLISRAAEERRSIRAQTLSAAVALSNDFDQEVAGVNNLLKGLSTSPALQSGDIAAFYQQLKRTPIPEGSWLILQDLEGQVANTLMPLGAALPRHRDFPTYPDALNRVRERGWTVSGRMSSIAKPGAVIVALSLRVDGADGAMKYFITTILSDARFVAIFADQRLPTLWTATIIDRYLRPIATSRGSGLADAVPTPAALKDRLSEADGNAPVHGMFESVDHRGTPVLVAFRRSDATNWTSTVEVPLVLVNAPIRGVLWQISGATALLLLVGVGVGLWIAKPIDALSGAAKSAKREVGDLSKQLLALQEDERKLIGRELHDSTTHHLVAASMALGRLERRLGANPDAAKIVHEIEEMHRSALMELRIFTYLLHPPELADRGLKAAIEEFVGGFAGRAGLSSKVCLPDEIDAIPHDLQRSVLRIVQEALTNVHRHADASRVHVVARIIRSRLLVRIDDNGHGLRGGSEREQVPPMGVGIRGMQARLRQFEGELRIKSGPSGTSVVAWVPVGTGTRTPSAVRLPTLSPALTDAV